MNRRRFLSSALGFAAAAALPVGAMFGARKESLPSLPYPHAPALCAEEIRAWQRQVDNLLIYGVSHPELVSGSPSDLRHFDGLLEPR